MRRLQSTTSSDMSEQLMKKMICNS